MTKEKMKDIEERLLVRMDEMEDKMKRTNDRMMEKLEGFLDKKLEATVTRLEGTLSTMAESLKRESIKVADLEKRMPKVEKRLFDMEKEVEATERKVIKELGEIEMKKNIIVVFGVPEGDKAKDAQAIDSILEVIAEKKIVFEVKFRIGQKEPTKVRPVIVTLHGEGDKETILKGSNKLKDHQHWKNVYLKPDMTKNQRDYIKNQEDELKAEAARRNSLLKNGEGWEWRVRGRALQRHLAKVHLRD